MWALVLCAVLIFWWGFLEPFMDQSCPFAWWLLSGIGRILLVGMYCAVAFLFVSDADISAKAALLGMGMIFFSALFGIGIGAVVADRMVKKKDPSQNGQ